MKVILTFLLFFGGLMQACAQTPLAPRPPERVTVLEAHGDRREDPYFWMRDRENPEVLAHLKAENEYVERVLEPVKELREKVLAEMRARIAPNDSTVPALHGGYFYYARYEAGKEYPIYARRKGSAEAPEELLLDVNALARGHDYTDVPFPALSPDHTKLIYAADFTGRRFYALHVVDLRTGQLLGAPIEGTTGNVEWANDNRTFFYSRQHPDTLRSQWIYRHELGAKKSTLVFEEKDETFNVEVHKARTDAFLFFVSSSTVSSEWRVLDANRPTGTARVFLPRERDHEYGLEDGGDAFYVVTNWRAKNFRLMKAPHDARDRARWAEVLPERADVLLEGVTFFRTHYVVSERTQALTRVRVVDRRDGAAREIALPDPVFEVGVDVNLEYDAPFLRYRYQSLNRPESIFDYDFRTGRSELRKQQPVPTFDASRYVSERLWATARDGTRVPVSLLYRQGTPRDGTAPLLQYAYGAYGLSTDPSFGSDIFSLVDRGFVYAIAHIRGGQELGRQWYEDGKLLHKMNSFTDFIDVTEFLVREKIADPGRIYAYGASAGGLLMGAVANLRPDLYRGVNAGVAFVDVLTTMLDESIPLTTSEYDEWGDPRKAEYYWYMKKYSPYDNVEAKEYPHMLITSGYHDSQVQYWEPTKWAAKLRKVKRDDRPVLLYTELEAGHGGASGRYESLKQVALEYSFYLMLEGIRE